MSVQGPRQRRSSSSASKDAALLKAIADRELDDAYANEAYLFGWSLPALFCALSVIGYHIPCYFIVRYVETHTDALVIDGQALPWKTFHTTMAAFGTSLMLDAVTWLWTVDKRIARLFMFPTVIKWNSFVSYWLMSNGMVPILLDFKGRRLMPTRYLQWFFTTPAMLYLYSILSFTRQEELVAAIILDELMLISGFLACYLDPPSNLVWLCASFGCFYFVICAINNMLLAAVERCSPDDEGHRRALTWARLFMTVTWSFIPLVWCLSAIDMISVTLEEQLLELFDVLSKAAASSMLLHCSMQTQSAKILVKQSAIIEEERFNVVKAVEETAVHKERFLAAISHELRTPLNGIIGLAENVIIGNCGAVAEKVMENLNTIKQSGQRLHSLVNDILDANSLKNQSMQVKEEPIDIATVCAEVVETVQKKGKKTSVELHANIEGRIPEVYADPVTVKKMLLHVLGNAVKFTEEGSVKFTVRLDREQRKLVYVVEDTGPGIADSQRDRVWGAFNQGDEGLGRKHGGTGLGLTLARQLVTAQKGEISFESQVGKGTTFTISTPAKLVDEGKLLEAPHMDPPEVRSLIRSRRFSLRSESGEGFGNVRLLSSENDSAARAATAPMTPMTGAVRTLSTGPAKGGEEERELSGASQSSAVGSSTPMTMAVRRSMTVHAAIPPMGLEEAEGAQKSPGSLPESMEGAGEGRRTSTLLLSPTASSFNAQGAGPPRAPPPEAMAQMTFGSVLCVHVDGWGSAQTASGAVQLELAVERLTSKAEALAASFGVWKMRSFSCSNLLVAAQTEPASDEHAVQLFKVAKELVKALELDEVLAEEGLQLRLGMHSGSLFVRPSLSRRSGEGPWVYGEAADMAALLAANAPAQTVHVSEAAREKAGKEEEWTLLGQVEGRVAGEVMHSFIARMGQRGGGGTLHGDAARRFRVVGGVEEEEERAQLQMPSSQPLPSGWRQQDRQQADGPAGHRGKSAMDAQRGGERQQGPGAGSRGRGKEKEGRQDSSFPRKEQEGGREEEEAAAAWRRAEREGQLLAQVQTLEVLLAAERLDASVRGPQLPPSGSTAVVERCSEDRAVAELLGPMSELQQCLLLLLKGKEELADFGASLTTEVEVLLAVLALERHAYALTVEEVTSLDVLLKMGEPLLQDVGVKSHISRARILGGARCLAAVAQYFREAAMDGAPPLAVPAVGMLSTAGAGSSSASPLGRSSLSPGARPLTSPMPSHAPAVLLNLRPSNSPASHTRDPAHRRNAPPLPRWEDYTSSGRGREGEQHASSLVVSAQRTLNGVTPTAEGADRNRQGWDEDRHEATLII